MEFRAYIVRRLLLVIPVLFGVTLLIFAVLQLFSPVERIMAKSLLWAGVAIFILLVVGFILYRAHIITIGKFLHHVSRQHFKQQKMAKARRPIGRPMVNPPYPPQKQYPQRTTVQQTPTPMPPRNPPKKYPATQQVQPPAQKYPTQGLPTPNKPAQKQEDVFGRLSNQVNNSKEDTFKKLASISK